MHAQEGPPSETEAAGPSEPASAEQKEPEQGDPAAAETLSQAREKLLTYRSVQAKIRERVSIRGREFVANGTYVQGADLKLRLEYDVTLGKGSAALRGSLLQVCDGQVLWARYLFESDDEDPEASKPQITRRDVQKILDAAASSGKVPENLLVAELGLGGLPALLASLQDLMVFNEQTEAEDGKFLIISGTWKKEFRDQIPSSDEEGANGRLPEHIPDAVKVYFDRENLFPRRILYLKKHPSRDFMKPMVSVDLVEVTLNAPVDDDQFQYVPPDKVFPVNITAQYLQRLAPQAQGGPQPPEGGAPLDPSGTPPVTPELPPIGEPQVTD